jgi:hypothetical protein
LTSIVSAVEDFAGGLRHHDEVRDHEQRDQRDHRDADPEQGHHAEVEALALADDGRPGAIAPQERDADQPDGAEEDDRRGDEHPPPQDRDAVRGAAARIERRLPVAAAAADGQREARARQGEHRRATTVRAHRRRATPRGRFR